MTCTAIHDLGGFDQLPSLFAQADDTVLANSDDAEPSLATVCAGRRAAGAGAITIGRPPNLRHGRPRGLPTSTHGYSSFCCVGAATSAGSRRYVMPKPLTSRYFWYFVASSNGLSFKRWKMSRPRPSRIFQPVSVVIEGGVKREDAKSGRDKSRLGILQRRSAFLVHGHVVVSARLNRVERGEQARGRLVIGGLDVTLRF